MNCFTCVMEYLLACRGALDKMPNMGWMCSKILMSLLVRSDIGTTRVLGIRIDID